jgi:hypothetical protein
MSKFSETKASRRAEKRAKLREKEELIKKGKEKTNKGEREKKSTKDQYKDVDEQLIWEGNTNFLMRIGFGAVFFWILFHGLLNYYRTLDVFAQLANAMLYSMLSTIMALAVSFLIVKLVAKKVEGERINYRDLHSKPDLAHFAYEAIAIMFSGILTVIGMTPFLWSNYAFYLFLIIYFIIKTISRAIAFVIGKLVSRKTFVAIGIIAIAVVLLFSAMAPVLTILSLL